jgi:hypothetical protein
VLQEWIGLLAGSCRLRIVECVVSDASLHRTRLENRLADTGNGHEISWAALERMKASLGPWTVDRLVVDATSSPDVACATVLDRFVGGTVAL